MFKNLSAIILITCSVFFGNSQEVFHQKITTADGLPSNSVYDIMQDSKGFIWFATDEGVSRFDGRHFKTFKGKNKGGKSGSFLKKDNFGRIWYENFDGYLNYIQNDSVYKLESQPPPLGFINYTIVKNQLIYATQLGYEVCDLKTLKIIRKPNLPAFQTCFVENNGGKTYFFDPFLKIISLHNNSLSIVNTALKINLSAPIFTNSDAIYCTDKNNTNNIMYKIENEKVYSLFDFKSQQTIQNLYFLQNKFWLCTNNGLFVLDKNGKQINEKAYFSNNSISSFFIDKENNYWVGTLNNGVFRFSDFNEIQTDLKEIKPLLLSRDQSKIYVGSENGKIFEISTNLEKLTKIPLQSKNQILNLNTLHPKYNFIASDGFYKTDKNFKILDKQTYALKSIDFINDHEAVIAVSGFIGFINISKALSNSTFGNFKYTNNHYRIKEKVRGKSAIWNNLENEALFLTNTGLFSYKNNHLIELQLPDKTISIKYLKKANNHIYALADDDKLYLYNRNFFTEIKINLQNITLFKSINNSIYIGTLDGIYELINNRLRLITDIIVSEKIEDLQADSNFYYVLHKSNMVRFSKNNLKSDNNTTTIYLEKILVNNEEYTKKNKLQLKHFQNDIKIHLAMLDFQKKHTIYYRINNQSWIEILNNGNVLQLSSLSPNQYKIEFSNQKNGKILQAVIFEIQKPVWEQIWFYLLCLIAFSSMIVALYNYRLKQITTNKNLIIDKLKLENYLNESKVKLIKAQMNPHFFFNALNTIQSYIATNETKEATDYLNKFSRLTRMILEMTDKSWIAVEDEIRMQNLYFDLQQIRLNDFSYEISLSDKNLNNLVIPTMILQPYIENAIIHGLTHKIGKKKLVLSFKIENNQLVIGIKDNGIGLKKSTEINFKNKSKSTSFATKATLERLEIINREDYKIAVSIDEIFDKNEQSQGTEVTLQMDLRYD